MLADCFVFVMAAHENMHLGQLSAWRRVQGNGAGVRNAVMPWINRR